MQPTTNRDIFQNPTRSLAIGQYMGKVYMWMTIGILVTAMAALATIYDPRIFYGMMENRWIFYALIFAEFGLVIWLSAGINRMNSLTATAMFLLYAALNGVTLSVIAVVYTQESIASAFFTTAAGFAGLSAFGLITKKDLSPVGNFCSMGLFGLVGFGLLSIFFPSLMGSTASKVYGLVGIIVFAGLTAYDTQAIKAMAPLHQGSEEHKKGAIIGALKLYLDFVNLFLFILRMTGRKR